MQRYRTKQHVRPGVSSCRPKKTKSPKSTSNLRDEWQCHINQGVSCKTVSRRLLGRGLHMFTSLPRYLCWPKRGRGIVWNGHFSTNIAQCFNWVMSFSLMTTISSSAWMEYFVLVANRDRGSMKNASRLLWPKEWVSVHVCEDHLLCGCNEPRHLSWKRQCWPLQACPVDGNAVICKEMLQQKFVNAPAHRARSLQEFLREEEVEQLLWPPYSPDLNPIDHVWDCLSRAMHQWVSDIKV